MEKGKQYSVFVLVVICLIFVFAGPAGAISVAFNPSYSEMMRGESFDLDIIISGLHDDNLMFFEFDLFYNDDILNFTGDYTLTDQLGAIPDDAFDTSFGDIGEGRINIGALSFLSNLTPQQDSFTMATLSFYGAAQGTNDFSLGNVTLWDEFSRDVGACVQKYASVDVYDPVPEPSTYILLSCGLLCFIGFRKRIVRC